MRGLRTSLVRAMAVLAIVASTLGAAQAARSRAPIEGAPSLTRQASLPRNRQVAAFNFDWDDNAVKMVTRLHLESRTGRPPLAVSTAEFAMLKHQLGKPGPYQDYRIGPETFRETRARGNFVRQLTASMKAAPERWQGPSWDRLVEALSTRRGARMTTIITARSSDPQELRDGLLSLKKAGLIKYVPPLANIYSVENPNAHFGGQPLVGRTGEKKATVMLGLLRRLNARPLPRTAATLRSADGAGFRATHLWGFSDDDWDNYVAARRVLAAHAHEFPNVKIRLMYTGTYDPRRRPLSEVVYAGGHRPLLPEEHAETARVDRVRQLAVRFGELRNARSPAAARVPTAASQSATSPR